MELAKRKNKLPQLETVHGFLSVRDLVLSPVRDQVQLDDVHRRPVPLLIGWWGEMLFMSS